MPRHKEKCNDDEKEFATCKAGNGKSIPEILVSFTTTCDSKVAYSQVA